MYGMSGTYGHLLDASIGPVFGSASVPELRCFEWITEEPTPVLLLLMSIVVHIRNEQYIPVARHRSRLSVSATARVRTARNMKIIHHHVEISV